MIRRLAAEYLGTFFLVLMGPGAMMVNAAWPGSVGPVGVALAFAFVVTAVVYALAPVSGAHINPAVTLTAWSLGKIPGREVVPYLIAQCAGAVTASSISRAALGLAGNLGATVPTIPVAAAFGVEWLLSFLLMLVILESGRSDPSTRGSSALTIGLTVGCCALVGGPLTGASMNPARSLGPAVAGGTWQGHWLYWLAPMTGMLAAARLNKYLHAGSAVESTSR